MNCDGFHWNRDGLFLTKFETEEQEPWYTLPNVVIRTYMTPKEDGKGDSVHS